MFQQCELLLDADVVKSELKLRSEKRSPFPLPHFIKGDRSQVR
ncbi:hypothetical protein [Microcoleus sp. N3A4]